MTKEIWPAIRRPFFQTTNSSFRNSFGPSQPLYHVNRSDVGKRQLLGIHRYATIAPRGLRGNLVYAALTHGGLVDTAGRKPIILKRSQEGGTKQLAAHLLKAEETEQMEIHELDGFVAEDLHGAFQEIYAVSRGTR